MADSKISALPASTTPLAGTEVLPIVQGGVTKQNSVANLTAGRAISAASLALTTALPVTSGGTGTTTTFTAGSVVFAGASGVYTQNNASIFWDNTNNCFGLGTASPSVTLHVEGGNARVNRASNSTILTLGGSPSDNWEGDIQFLTSNSTYNWRLASNRIVSGTFTITPSTATGGSTFTTAALSLDSSGNLTISGATATKASGTTWANPSDIRLKQNIASYTKGLQELRQVQVKTWEYNGKGGTTAGMKSLGVIADEAMSILPDSVDTYSAKLNLEDEQNTDIKRFDATETTWLLVKSVQEQQVLIEQQAIAITQLTERLSALEAR